MKKILLFQVDNPLKVKQAIATMRLRVESIPNEKFNKTVESLLNGSKEEEIPYSGEMPQGSLLLMCGLNNTEVDQVLFRLKSQKITTTYKAVLTPTNLGWNVLELFQEMEKERKEIESRRNK
jgi:hypothetical protein